ncbi:MAG: sensor histidine kinase, partial [Chloroflexota bacterium]
NNHPVVFTDEDRQLLEMFANQGAISIENARLLKQVQQLAILEERERFGMDLHDGIIQSIYGVGLVLDDLKQRVGESPELVTERISEVAKSLNMVSSDIRNYILDLRPHHFEGKSIIEGIEELARALRANTFMNVLLNIENDFSSTFPEEITLGILHIAQEAFTNIQKHSKATEINIKLGVQNNQIELLIGDNGVSMHGEKMYASSGNGLKNMRHRAESLGGEIEISSDDGTQVLINIPVN